MRAGLFVPVILCSLATSAWALTINFDPATQPPGDLPASITPMGNSPGSAVPASADLSNQYEGSGVLFSSTAPYVAVVDVGGMAASPPDAIGGVTAGGLLSYADPVTFTFVLPGTTTSGVTNNISVQADNIGIDGQYATLSVYDSDGNLLKSQTLEDVGSEVWTLDVPGIHSATFNFPTTSSGALTTGSPYGSGTGIALDDLTFGTVTSVGTTPPPGATTPLPPAVWSALPLLASLGVVGVLRRRVRGF